MMGEIVERYPNGNYKIRAIKRIAYRGGYRMLTMIGVAKSADITEEDTIGSGKLYEYRLEVIR
jgi:flagellar basal body L-ring protein FlgH